MGEVGGRVAGWQERQQNSVTRFLLTPVGSAGDVNPYIGVVLVGFVGLLFM